MHYRTRSYDARTARYAQKASVSSSVAHLAYSESTPEGNRQEPAGAPSEISVSAEKGAGTNFLGVKLGWIDNEEIRLLKDVTYKLGFSFEVKVTSASDATKTIVEQSVATKYKQVGERGTPGYSLTPTPRGIDITTGVTEKEWSAFDVWSIAKRGNDKLFTELRYESPAGTQLGENGSSTDATGLFQVAGNTIRYVDIPGPRGGLEDSKWVRETKVRAPVRGFRDQEMLINIRAYDVSEKSVAYGARKTQLEHSVYLRIFGDGSPTKLVRERLSAVGFGTGAKKR